MKRIVNIEIEPSGAFDEKLLRMEVAKELPNAFGPFNFRLIKRSLDARGRIRFNIRAEVFSMNEPMEDRMSTIPRYRDVSASKKVHIIGAGPAGLFAALRCLQLGLKPVIIERGKDVRERRRDVAILSKEHVVNPESNYCFGEGGAGAYSDGKLYTRSKKRGHVEEVLAMLVQHGAHEDIMVDAHPHIGTNKLPMIITGIRERIRSCGGEIHFQERLEDIEVKDGRIQAIRTTSGEHSVQALILATGHSARDIFHLLKANELFIEYKPFALGVRVEHPQELIDKSRYRSAQRGDYLPPASYSVVCQVDGRGAYSFCMCPGGVIAPCATSPGEVVTNGWSPSKRNNPFANSGIVVEVRETELKGFDPHDPLRGMYFQASVEQRACESAGGSQTAPAQRLTDFVNGRVSSSLPACSYYPGVMSVDLMDVLPEHIAYSLKESFKIFNTKIPGYLTEEALVVATESRTSSPVRIPRDPETLEHPQAAGLYPCGEGAGYAGGIVSAAIDGMRCVEQIKLRLGVD